MNGVIMIISETNKYLLDDELKDFAEHEDIIVEIVPDEVFDKYLTNTSYEEESEKL